MKLVIVKENKEIYACVEDEDHFNRVKKDRENLRELPQDLLDSECNLQFLPDNSFMVFNLHQLDNFKKRKK